MPLASARALIINRQNFNENDRLVVLLTEKDGIQKAIAPGAARGKNRFGSALEFFTELKLFYYWHQERELWTISRADIINSYFQEISLPENIFKFYLIAEITARATPQNVEATRLFRLLQAVLRALKLGVPASILLTYYLIWFLKIEGLLFNPQRCANCQHNLDNQSAFVRADFRGLLCSQCRQDEYHQLTPPELALISSALRLRPEQLITTISLPQTTHLISLLLEKIEYHLEIKLQSKYSLF